GRGKTHDDVSISGPPCPYFNFHPKRLCALTVWRTLATKIQIHTGGGTMRHAVFASDVLTFTLAQPALAQLEDKPVPMDKAPFHIPVFQNDWIILLNVNIPPGRNTGYHIHYADSVSVNLMPASQTNQDYGSKEVSAPGTGGDGEPGRATFTDVNRNGPRTHKATNVGPTPFHNSC